MARVLSEAQSETTGKDKVLPGNGQLNEDYRHATGTTCSHMPRPANTSTRISRIRLGLRFASFSRSALEGWIGRPLDCSSTCQGGASLQALKTNGIITWRTFEFARTAAEVNLKAIGYRLSSDAVIARGVIELPRLRLGSAALRTGAYAPLDACGLAAVLLPGNRLLRTAPKQSQQRSR